jgi:polyhydroxybutyrate depolymerase
VDDLYFFDALLDRLAADYSIDTARVYVSGFSNGASFVGRLVQERSKVIAAAGAGSGSPHVSAARVERPISVMHWFGNRDDRLLPEGLNAYPMSETVLVTPPIKSQMVLPYLTMLGLADRYTFSELTMGGKRAVRCTYSTSLTGAANTYTITMYEGLFHQYPDGDNYPVAAADFVWELFETQAIR